VEIRISNNDLEKFGKGSNFNVLHAGTDSKEFNDGQRAEVELQGKSWRSNIRMSCRMNRIR
jgi:hypothetical protein